MAPHEHVTGANRGDGHLADVQGAIAKVVADLLHIVLKKRRGEETARIRDYVYGSRAGYTGCSIGRG
jgi:hypothetical protein